MITVGKYRICTVKTPNHGRGLYWFTALVRAFSPYATSSRAHTNLERSLNFYLLFAESGDTRYLGMAERFLQSAMIVPK